MKDLYSLVGAVVVWVIIVAVCLAVAYGLLRLAWYFIGKTDSNKHPWLMWTVYYVTRPFGVWNKSKRQLCPPFYYNRSDNRKITKEQIPVTRSLQANIARYNRRRWAKIK